MSRIDPLARARLAQALTDYARREPAQAAVATAFIAFLDSSPRVFERGHRSGHFTASAWIVDDPGEHVLLLLHRKLGRWLQPGGHADGELDLARVAAREATEETGIRGLQALPEIYDIDCHGIPARGHEPAHLHWDVRYAFIAPRRARARHNAEALRAAWVPIPQLAIDPQAEPSVARMAQRWLKRTALAG